MPSHNPYDPDRDEPESDNPLSLSRRNILKHGTAAIVGGGAALLSGAPTFAQAPSVVTQPASRTAGQKFRALVRYRTSLDIQELTLLQIQPREVVIRVQAGQACYTQVGALDTRAPVANANVFGHGAVGVVEEVGPMVKRVQVGDRVIVGVRGQCGECFECLAGRGNRCDAAFNRYVGPVATMSDGTPVTGDLGGFAELMVAWEEMCVPVFTKHSAAELSLIACVTMTGLGMAMLHGPVEPSSNVVVFGAGPVGLSAVQGARIMGASKIIVVEPIRYRRDLALKVGATTVLDPNAEGDSKALLAKIVDLTKAPTDRPFAGGRGGIANGPDVILEAVGGERFVPRVERGPDPTGIEVLQQIYALCPGGGWMKTSGVGFPAGATVTFPAGVWTNGSKSHFSGNIGGTNVKRDYPRWVRLMETGQFDGRSLVGVTVPLDRWREALEAAAYRTAITGVVVFS